MGNSEPVDGRDRRVIRDGQLTIGIGADGDSWLVDLAGELDLSAAPSFEREVEALLSSNGHKVMIDLGELAFIDSSGAQVLLRLVRNHRPTPGAVKLRGPRGEVARILRLTGLDAVLPIVD